MSEAIPAPLFRNLLLRSEVPRLAEAFAKPPAIPLLVFKGVALATLLGRTIADRHILDIDLLICPTRRADAAARLESLGYRASGGVSWQQSRAEGWQVPFVRYHDGLRLDVDLHWRLLSPWLFAESPSVDAVSRSCELQGSHCLTLTAEWTVLQLAAHWVQHEAMEERILADFAEAVARLPFDEERLFLTAERWGLTRALQHALHHAPSSGRARALGGFGLDRGTRAFDAWFKRKTSSNTPSLRRHLAVQLLGDRRSTAARVARLALPGHAQLDIVAGRALGARRYVYYPYRLLRGAKRLLIG